MEWPRWRGRCSWHAPKGQNKIAQGFSPGFSVLAECALKAAPDSGVADGAIDWTRCGQLANILAPLSGRGSFPTNPGLKPWAMLLCPFGAFNPLSHRSYRALRDGRFCERFQAINCLATIIKSLRDNRPCPPGRSTFRPAIIGSATWQTDGAERR